MLKPFKPIRNLIKPFYVVLFLLFATPFLSMAQKVKVSAGIDASPKIQIGDQFNIELQVSRGKETKVVWPFIPDTLGKIERLDSLKRDTMPQQDGSVIERCKFKVTVFDTGTHVIPPFKFVLANGDSLLTEALNLEVFAPKIDTTKAIRDIKDPLSIPYTFKELAPYIVGGLLLIGIIVYLIYYLRKRKQNQPLFTPKIPAKPAHELALELLEQLEKEKLWQQGKVKTYHSELTDIIRGYIEHRFKITALEQTSEETILHFRSIDISEDLKQKLAQILRLSDMVKFAKAQPIGNENELSLKSAYEFVKQTMLVIETTIKSEEITNSNPE